MNLLKWTIASVIILQVCFVITNLIIGAKKAADYSISCQHVDNPFFTQHNYDGNTPFTSFKAGEYQAEGAMLYCRGFNYFN
ncbi:MULTISPECIES: hypothetical protein [Shewanella]|uniref:hypothetical protein n=1 Tax=Shewanella TaxID=22 RepID=UPI00048B3846|nr:MULTISPECIES: hypothetical protein [Shewanella]